jgi:ribonuclease P protein component
MHDQRFRRKERLRLRTDFDRVFARKCSVHDGHLALHGCENGLPHSRFAASVSKRFGNAVVRNHFRRWFKEAFRLRKEQLPTGLDLVLVLRNPAGLEWEKLLTALPALAERLQRRLERAKPEP